MSTRLRKLAGTGKGTIYRHFPSKLELFAAVVERGQIRCYEDLPDLIEAKCGVSEHITTGLTQFVDFFVEYPNYYRVMMIEQPELRLKVKLDMDAGYHHFLKVISAMVKEDIHQGRIKKVDPAFAAQFFLSLMKLIVERQLYGKGHSRRRDIREAVEITLKGLEK